MISNNTRSKTKNNHNKNNIDRYGNQTTSNEIASSRIRKNDVVDEDTSSTEVVYRKTKEVEEIFINQRIQNDHQRNSDIDSEDDEGGEAGLQQIQDIDNKLAGSEASLPLKILIRDLQTTKTDSRNTHTTYSSTVDTPASTTNIADNVDSSSEEELHDSGDFDRDTASDSDYGASAVKNFAKTLGADLRSKRKYATVEMKQKDNVDNATEATHVAPTSTSIRDPTRGHTCEITICNDDSKPRRTTTTNIKNEGDGKVNCNTSVFIPNQMMLKNTSKKRPSETVNGGHNDEAVEHQPQITPPFTKKLRLMMTASNSKSSSIPNIPADATYEVQSDAYQSKLWYQMLQELIESKNNFEYNRSLFHWVASQRRHYYLRKKNQPSTMTDERIAGLEQIGFAWSLQESVWYQGLCEHRDKMQHGDLPLQYSFFSEGEPVPDPSELGTDSTKSGDALIQKLYLLHKQKSKINRLKVMENNHAEHRGRLQERSANNIDITMNSQPTYAQKNYWDSRKPSEVESEERVPKAVMNRNRKGDSQSKSITLEVKSEDHITPDTVLSEIGQIYDDSVCELREEQSKTADTTDTFTIARATAETASCGSTSSEDKGDDDDDAPMMDIFTAALILCPDGSGRAKSSPSVAAEAVVPLSNDEVVRDSQASGCLFEVTAPAGKLGIELTETLVVCRIFPHCKLGGSILVGDRLVRVNGVDVVRWAWDKFEQYVAETECQERVCLFFRPDDSAGNPRMKLKKTRSGGGGGEDHDDEGTTPVEPPHIFSAPQFQNGTQPRAARPLGKTVDVDGNNESMNGKDVLGAKRKSGIPLPARERLRNEQMEVWIWRLNEAKQFRDEHGHCCIPCDYPANQPLASWAKRQRYLWAQYRKHHQSVGGSAAADSSADSPSISKFLDRAQPLTPERIASLNGIGFCWDNRELSWFQKFEEFKAIMVKLKTSANDRALYRHINLTSPKLRNWLKRQRRQHKKWLLKQPSHMTAERSDLLTSIGFEFRFKLT